MMGVEYTLALYLRISEDDGFSGESQSIGGQRDEIRDFIGAHPELRDARQLEFVDDGFSGTNFDRPGVSELLRKVKSGEIQCIVVKDFSRLGRNYIDVGDYLEQIFPFLKVRFISVNDGYDSSRQESLAGDIQFAFKNIMNDYYSKDLSRKIKAGIQILRKSGKYLSPYAIFGYRKSPDDPYRLAVDGEAAAIVKRIFQMKLAGEFAPAIARALNAENIPTPMVYKKKNGLKRDWNTHAARNVWTDGMIRCLLRDVRYTGAVVQGMHQSHVVGSQKTHVVPREQWHIVHGQHEAIISKEDYERVQAGFNPQKNLTQSRRISPLAGKVRCGGCGYALRKSNRKVQEYFCGQRQFAKSDSCFCGSISVSVVENTVLAALQKLFDAYSMEEKRQNDKGTENASIQMDSLRQIQTLQKQIAGIKDAKLALYHRYSDGEITKEEYFRLRDAEESKMQTLTEETARLEQKRFESQVRVSGSRYEALKNLCFEGRLTKETVDALVDSIMVYDENRIEIKWKFEEPVN